MRSRRGFTLLEGLFSLFLVSLVLGGIVHTLNQAAQVKRNTKNLDQTMEEFHALLSLQGDLNAAMQISAPGPGASANRLTLRRVDPSLSYSDRTSPVPARPDAHLDPFEGPETMEVDYLLEDGYLIRVLTIGTETPRRIRFLKVKELTVSRVLATPSLVTLEIVLERERVEKTRILNVSLRDVP